MALTQKFGSIRALKSNLRKLPITASADIARGAAPTMTKLASGDFDGGRSVYGGARPLGEDGRTLNLVRSGATRAAMRFIATGRDIRTARLPKYARYLIGKYDILPNGPLPKVWRTALGKIANDVLSARAKRLGDD